MCTNYKIQFSAFLQSEQKIQSEQKSIQNKQIEYYQSLPSLLCLKVATIFTSTTIALGLVLFICFWTLYKLSHTVCTHCFSRFFM